jgi:hypothetical protein
MLFGCENALKILATPSPHILLEVRYILTYYKFFSVVKACAKLFAPSTVILLYLSSNSNANS